MNELFSLYQVDCLSPVNHQRLCVLFSSSSAQSSNAPSACVSPWYEKLLLYSMCSYLFFVSEGKVSAHFIEVLL